MSRSMSSHLGCVVKGGETRGAQAKYWPGVERQGCYVTVLHVSLAGPNWGELCHSLRNIESMIMNIVKILHRVEWSP
jgi:hypothetical protein